MSNSSLCMRGQWHPQEICEHLPLTSREIGWNMSRVARCGKRIMSTLTGNAVDQLVQTLCWIPVAPTLCFARPTSSLRLKPAMPALPHCQPERPSAEKTTLKHSRARIYWCMFTFNHLTQVSRFESLMKATDQWSISTLSLLRNQPTFLWVNNSC